MDGMGYEKWVYPRVHIDGISAEMSSSKGIPFLDQVKQGHEAADHTEASRKHVVAEDLQEGNNDNVQMLLEWLL